jgi:LPXTG-site transpeptidase (sortase) family protein
VDLQRVIRGGDEINPLKTPFSTDGLSKPIGSGAMKRFPRIGLIFRVLIFCAVGLYSLSQSTPAFAASLLVNSSGDGLNNDGVCTLREAITNANDNATTWIDCAGVGFGADTIRFAAGITTITLTSNLPNIYDSLGLTIDGTVADGLVQINGAGVYRPFSVNLGASLALSGLEIINGQASGANGGAILNNGVLTVTESVFSSNRTDQSGGAIFNAGGGTIMVSSSTFSNNQAALSGGAIYSADSATVSSSTFDFNHADAKGGAIYNAWTLSLVNSTLWENSAGMGGIAAGGGIYNAGILTLRNSTLSSNWHDNLYNAVGATLDFANTILAESNGDCANYGTITVNTRNLIQWEEFLANSCVGGDTIHDEDPKLKEFLEDNGGPTETLALRPGSPAIDSGDGGLCELTDQRGVGRPQYSGCDIGAYERDDYPPTNIDLSNDTLSENQPIGTLVGLLSSTDPDSGDTHSYNLQTGVVGCSSSGNSSFQIPTGTSQLQSAVIFDYETPPTSFSICIRSTDQGGLSFDKQFTISINDLDDLAPDVTSILRQDPPASPTHAISITFRVTFAEGVQFVDTPDFILSLGGTATGAINSIVVQSASVYDVVITLVSGNGSIDLGFAPGNNIADLASNPLGPAPSITTQENYIIDNTFPTLVYGAHTNPVEGSILANGPTQIVLEFNKNVLADGSANAANNPANYVLVEEGMNAFTTLSCDSVDPVGDQRITVDAVIYDNNGGAGPFLATLFIHGESPLPGGNYRLFICGTTSIYDPSGLLLNNGTDSPLNFRVSGPALIPATGFAPGRLTILPAQKIAYANSDLWLEIPKLGVVMDIVGVPQSHGTWDVTWLGRDAGWLEGSAFPTWQGNTVITGHVWDALNRPGPFVNLHTLLHNDQVILHGWGDEYVYAVRSVGQVHPDETNAIMHHEEHSWVTLVTCHGYDEMTGGYRYRVIVRAILVDVR